MSDRHKRSQHFRFLLVAGLSSVALAVCGGPSASQTSEIDSYEAAIKAAVTSQSKAEALNFIRDFASSHLVGDLIASLPPAVAQQVCGDLQGGGPAKARKACASLRQAVAFQPLVPPAEIAPAAGSAVLDPVSTGASAPAGALAADLPEGEQTDIAGTNIPYRPVTPAPATAGTAAADPVPNAADTLAGVSSAENPISPAADASAGISFDDEPEGELGAGDTDRAGVDLFYVPDAEASPGADRPVVDSVSTAADASADASSDDEPEIEQGAGITDEADAGLLYLPATAVAPAAGSAAAAPESGAVTSNSSVPSDDEPRGGHGNGDRDNATSIIPQTASTLTTTSFTAAPSVSTTISAPAGVPSVDDPDTSNVQSGSALSNTDQDSSTQSSNDESESTKSGNTESAQSSSAQSGSTKSGKTKSGNTESTQSSGDQSGSTQSSSDQSGSTKSGKTKSGNTESAQSSGDQSGSTQSGGDQSSSGKGKSDKGKNGKGKDNSGKNKG